MLTALGRVYLAVGDPEAATDHYARLLGRGPSWRGLTTEGEVESTIFGTADVQLQLLAPGSDGAVARALRTRLQGQGEGLYGLGFDTDDAGAAAAFLQGQGLPVGEPMEGGAVEPDPSAGPRWRVAMLPPSSTRGTLVTVSEPLHAAELLAPAPAGAADSAALVGLDHVVIQTSNPDAAIALYRDQLGLRLALDRTFERRDLRILFFRLAGVTVEVVHPLKGDVGPSDRFGGLAWRTPDVLAARERLVRQGFDVSEARDGHKAGTRVCTVRSDTHGVPTLLIGPDPG